MTTSQRERRAAFQPAVRIVFGRLFRAASAPTSPINDATELLRARVKAHLARRYRADVERVAVFPAATSGLLVAGVASTRAPIPGDTPLMMEPGSPVSRDHAIVSARLDEGPAADAAGEVTLGHIVAATLDELADDAAWKALGLTPETLPEDARAGEPSEPRFFLLSDDGREGAVAYGLLYWRAGDRYEAGRVRTWVRRLADVDDCARLVGVALASVGGAHPAVAALPTEWGRYSSAAQAAARAEVLEQIASDKPMNWWLVA